ncbi:putative phage abortive infection protein [Vibrio campbellii]|uniref:putative phage abortive infection protein n=1 Tax=Vibrio campbellii TaxID=680 RepID=UPI00210D9097|nr:putative phage abortive infection protein [Vibrio campbellii]UTZ43333.1 hypothetical protein HB764_18675 [Vibrio campbellii]
MNDLNCNTKQMDTRFNALIGVIAFLAVLASIYFFSEYKAALGNKTLPEDIKELAGVLGAKGDYYGGLLNSVFGFLSLTALLYTIVLQSRELSLSRQELELTRKEVARSADAQELSQKALNQQAFENTFFNMLNLRAEIIRNLEVSLPASKLIPGKIDVFKGNSVFNQVMIFLCEGVKDTDLYESKVKEKFKKFQLQKAEVLGSYFNNLKQILLFIDGYMDLDDKSKRKYANILKGQFSSDEINLLFLHGLDESSYDQKEFVNLAKKYEIFEFINFKHNDVNEKFKQVSKSASNGGNVTTFPALKDRFTFSCVWLAKYSEFDEFDNVTGSAFGSNPGFQFYKYQVRPIESEVERIKQKAAKESRLNV